MPRSLVALGSNLGDRGQTLARAVELLRANPQVSSLACSRFRETAPVGGAPGQGPFLNAAVCLETTLAPAALHADLRHIEDSLGRQRNERWAPRVIDLDLLLYGDLILDTQALQVPHPRMAFRRFVLEPAVEVASDMVHPAIGWTLARLLEHLNAAAPYLALLGLPGRGKTVLATSLAQVFQGCFVADTLSRADNPYPSDPPSRVYERQIQFLNRRTDLLDRGQWLQDDLLAISDFYWDQCLAYARLELDTRDFEIFCQAAERARPRVISPKLLVVLDIPPDGSASVRRPQGSDRLRNELLCLAGHPHRGPVLYVNSSRLRSPFDEVSAAIEAMK
ncbi:MAG: 2-amino-4-hydroxy-6-hydroxymethyldihydropteridine diphosphokinase [Planctomycetia bacterium]|nr:2-amino-4-hydroxy-6-hydroxymethyldihydropteridine diphosphokinase [Planctomycetia bacterium]